MIVLAGPVILSRVEIEGESERAVPLFMILSWWRLISLLFFGGSTYVPTYLCRQTFVLFLHRRDQSPIQIEICRRAAPSAGSDKSHFFLTNQPIGQSLIPRDSSGLSGRKYLKRSIIISFYNSTIQYA